MWPLAALLALPVIEIALFVSIGGAIGLGPTLIIVLLGPLVGFAVIRSAGARAMADLRAPIGGLRDPAVPVAEGAIKVIAGILLILPGFLTDAIGLALLLPPLRHGIVRALGRRVVVVGGAGAGRDPFRRPDPRRPGADVIDGEFHEIPQGETSRRPADGRSGWTRD
ncbi:FxsA family protein [Frigidibacter sp. MR17.24]|uniref:FxsA family protein n=1 Tax=Frigidibacter sp. MR17.24 TaxID=3127345 RepID=UPI003012C3C8